MPTTTPGNGALSRVRTWPRITETRRPSIAPVATPLWMGLAPL
jgi:hypothetical protein